MNYNNWIKLQNENWLDKCFKSDEEKIKALELELNDENDEEGLLSEESKDWMKNKLEELKNK